MIRGIAKKASDGKFYSFVNSSDDQGSDSSIDDGLPKHLEVIAAAKVDLFILLFFNNKFFFLKLRLKKTRKKVTPAKPTKDTKKKDEIDKENSDKVISSTVFGNLI